MVLKRFLMTLRASFRPFHSHLIMSYNNGKPGTITIDSANEDLLYWLKLIIRTALTWSFFFELFLKTIKNLSEQTDIKNKVSAHLTAAIMTVWQFPPRKSFNSLVNLLSLYGTKPLLCSNIIEAYLFIIA